MRKILNAVSRPVLYRYHLITICQWYDDILYHLSGLVLQISSTSCEMQQIKTVRWLVLWGCLATIDDVYLKAFRAQTIILTCLYIPFICIQTQTVQQQLVWVSVRKWYTLHTYNMIYYGESNSNPQTYTRPVPLVDTNQFKRLNNMKYWSMWPIKFTVWIWKAFTRYIMLYDVGTDMQSVFSTSTKTSNYFKLELT